MKTKEQVMQACIKNETYDFIDSPFVNRFLFFCTKDEIGQIGVFSFEDYAPTKEWSRENVLAQLEEDVAYGFNKALNQRGLSASDMYKVVLCWMWVLEDELQDFEQYAQYGLPLLKAVAVKYGFENPIGDDSGSEDKYAG